MYKINEVDIEFDEISLPPVLSFRGFVGQNLNVFIIAMDDSDWAIHDSNLAARWHKLADFD